MSEKHSIWKDGTQVRRFLATILCSGLAYGFYRGIQDNYLAEIVGISEFGRGVVEFFREMPGLLLIFILAAMYRFSENKVFKIGTAIMLAGIAGLLIGGSNMIVVVIFMVLFSTGEHIVMPVKSSLSLGYAQSGKGGAALGVMSGISHGGNIVGYLGVAGLFAVIGAQGWSARNGFKAIFLIACLLLVVSTVIVTSMKDTGKTVRRSRLYFAKKFSKYYMLEVFYGARKQVFLTFAPYVLILHYGAETSVISLLMAVCAASGMVFAPIIGKIIDKLGYKTVMVGDTLILMVVCFFYGFAHRLFPQNIAFIVVCVNYVLDSIISLASLASSVYVQDIADNREEVTATITTGISVNHLISVAIALLGGWIWKSMGIEVLFSMSAILGLINTLYAATIKVPATKPKQ
jgi:MFS family permease